MNKSRTICKEVFLKDIGYFIVILGVQLLQVLISVSMPYILTNIIDNALSKVVFKEILISIVIYGLLAAGFCVSGYIYASCEYRWRIHFEYKMQERIVYQCCDSSRVKTLETGEVDTMLKKDIIDIESHILFLYSEIPGNIIRALCLGIVLCLLNWKLALCIFIANITVVCLQKNLNQRIQRNAVEMRKAYSRLFDVINEICVNINVIGDVDAQQYVVKKHRAVYSDTGKCIKKGIRMNSMISQEISFLGYIVQIIVLCLGSYLCTQGEVTVGILVSFLQYSGQFMGPMEALLKIPTRNANVNESLKRVSCAIDEYGKNVILDETKRGSGELGEIFTIKIDDVSFKYNNDDSILSHANAVFQKGKINLLYGSSGSGKSTLIKILLGRIKEYEGLIVFQEVIHASIARKKLNQLIAWLPQEDVIFKDTILSNITLQNKEIAIERVIEVCKELGIYEDIMKMEFGYETVINPDSRNLSGGQIKRIILARTILLEKEILIVDEPTASLDEINTYKVFRYLEKISERKMVIVVTHDIMAEKFNSNSFHITNYQIQKNKNCEG